MKTNFVVRECLAFGFVAHVFNGTVADTIRHIKNEWQEELNSGYDFIVYNEDETVAFSTPEAFTSSLVGYM